MSLSISEAKSAVRIGVARAISEAGMVPHQAESMFKRAFGVGGESTLRTLGDFLKNYVLLWGGAGAAAGAYAGHLHHKINQSMSGDDDPEISTLQKKTDAYHRMSSDLSQSLPPPKV